MSSIQALSVEEYYNLHHGLYSPSDVRLAHLPTPIRENAIRANIAPHYNFEAEDENEKLMHAVFGNQYHQYQLDENALADFGFVIPESVKNAGKVIKRGGFVVDDDDRSIYTISSDSDSEHTSFEDTESEYTNTLHNDTQSEYAGIDVDEENIIATGTYGNPINLVTPTTAHTIIPSMSAEICNVEVPDLTSNDENYDNILYENGLAYDASPATLHYFNQAAVHITTRELVDDFVAAQATNLAGGALDIDQVAEAEREFANDAFFAADGADSFTNPPSPHILDGTYNPGYLNYATAMTAQNETAVPLEVDDLADPDYYLGPDGRAPDDSIFDRAAESSARVTTRVSSTPSYTTLSSRKRAASAEPDTTTTKKARIASRGFAGQFTLFLPPTMAETGNSTEAVTFGDRRNANGVILNPAFSKCSYFHSLDWEEDSQGDADLQAMLAYAKTKAELAEEIGRDEGEQQMRKLCHLECAEARLTGRAVGLYRYEEGHMTVEEYVENGVCVCWEGCWCSKFCTRYGDVLCPCARHLILEA